MAANLYRTEVRATEDVDLQLAIEASELTSVLKALDAQGWKPDHFVPGAYHLRLKKYAEASVDLIFAGTEYEKRAVSRAVGVEMIETGMTIMTVQIEDLIVLKLIAGRPRDYEAVAAMINSHPASLDEEYILAALAEFGMEDRWPEAIHSAELERGEMSH